MGAAAVEGVAAGATAAGASGTGAGGTGSASAGSATATSTGKGGPDVATGGLNQPTRPQSSPRPLPTLTGQASGGFGGGATIEGHAEQLRNHLSEALGGDDTSSEGETSAGSAVPEAETVLAATGGGRSNGSGGGRPSQPGRRGPTVHRYNIGTWGTYHAARLVARTVASAAGTKDSDGKN